MEKNITFSVDGIEISGTLKGSPHTWTFSTENEFFKRNCGAGFIAKHSFGGNSPALANGLKKIYTLVCEEAEYPGM
jgi:hypothetical protein